MLEKDKILNDLARLAGGAVGALGGMSEQIRAEIRSRVEELAARLDLVPREDFERLEAVVIRAREEQDRLNARLEALEKTSGGQKAKTVKTKTTKKTEPKTSRKVSASRKA